MTVKIKFIDHSSGHAAYAYFSTGKFKNKTLVLTLDAFGDYINYTANLFIPKKNKSIEIKRIKNYIAINIFDNGIGFLKKTTKELIKPYYTTKEKGSGLGLSIVNKIINDHNGAIEFNSNTTGTNIIINLPIK